MWIIFCGLILAIIELETVNAKSYPILLNTDAFMKKTEFIRNKRQFRFPQSFQGIQNNGFNGNGIFFDNDNMFNDFVQPSRARGNPIRTTPRPQGFTTVGVPGMGTTQSACEDRCRTTSQYDPVCGDNNVTYMNMARFRCAIGCGKNVQIAAFRACPRV